MVARAVPVEVNPRGTATVTGLVWSDTSKLANGDFSFLFLKKLLSHVVQDFSK